jgi:hypothetical protein
MSNPRIVPYWTTYGNRPRRLRASDAYNAAANRISQDTGLRWTCCETGRSADGKLKFIVRRRQQMRRVTIGI